MARCSRIIVNQSLGIVSQKVCEGRQLLDTTAKQFGLCFFQSCF